MEYEINYELLQQDIKRQLGLEEKSFYKDGVISNEGYLFTNVITYDRNKSISGKYLIDDITGGFCSSSQRDNEDWILFSENYRRVKFESISLNCLLLEINCLIEGSIVSMSTIDRIHTFLSIPISFKKEFILEGSEYKVYTLFNIKVKLPNGMNGLKITNDSIHSVLEVNSKGYEIINNLDWLNYISLVFQECVERNIEQLKQ